MEFKLTYKGPDSHSDGVERFQTAPELIQAMTVLLAQWNNFHGHEHDLEFVVRKVPSDTPTLGVSVDDLFKTSERMGG